LAALTAEARQARLFALVRRCFRAQAQQRPLLLVLEGLHWADQASLALLDDLTMYVENAPIFLVITFRADAHLTLATLARPCCTPVALSELAAQPARQLLNQLVGVSELPAAVEQHLGLRDRDGRDSPVNPLFLEEAVRMLQGIGVLRQNGRVQVNEALLAQVQVPDTIHGLLLARLDRLPVAERDLLQVASVIGRQFAAEPLTMLSAEPSPQVVVEMLANLSAAEMTRLVEAAPAWIYLFQHAMTHEVAYESLPFGRRQMLHALIADWLIETHEDNLPPIYPALAYHYGRAANDEKGLEYALKAGHAARDIFANQEAVDLYSQAERHLQALGEEGWWETAVDLYLSRSNALIRLGNLDVAFNDATHALRIAEQHQVINALAQSCNLMAQIRYRQGDYEAVLRLTNRAITLSSKELPADLLASAYTWAGWAASSQMHYDLALSYLNQAEQICVAENDNFRLALVMEAVSYTHYLRQEMELSLAAMQRSVALSRQFSTPINLGIALNNIGFVQYMLGRYDEAVQTFDEAVVIGRESGRNLLVPALSNRAAALCGMGHFSAALLDFQEADDLLRSMNYPGLWVEMRLFWGFEYYSALAEWEQARQQFEQARQWMDLQPEAYGEERVRLLLGLGLVDLRQGSLPEAQTWLHDADLLIAERGFAWWQPVVAYFLGLLYLQNRQQVEAKAHFERGLAASNEGGCPDYKPLLLLQLALLEEGEKQAAYLEQCVTAVNKRSRFLDRLWCLRQAGTLLARYPEPQRQELGQRCLNQAHELEIAYQSQAKEKLRPLA
jgi:tetratricopeptide (TPR) repeat protein